MNRKYKRFFVIAVCLPSAVQVAAQELENSAMVITATRIERQLFNTPQAITVITDKDIEESNVATTPDILSTADGVYVQKTNLGGGAPFIRGMTGKQVLILVDGVRLNNSYYRFGPHQYLNTIDPNIIERIEVVRGPSSVLYGTDALGGVINIITKTRHDFSQAAAVDGLAQVDYFSAMDGTGLRLQADGNAGNFGYLLGITAKDYGDLEGGGDVGKQVPSAYKENDADIKLNWRLGGNDQLILNLQQSDQQDVPKTSEVTLGSKTKFNYEPQERQLAYLEYQAQGLGVFDSAKFTLSYNRQKEGEQIIDRSSPTTETHELTDVKTAGAGVQLANQAANHRFVYGLDYYADKYSTSKQSIDLTSGTTTALTPGTPDGATYDSLGVYLQDEISLDKLAELILGLRYSKYEAKGQITGHDLNLDTDATTGSVHGLYHLTPSWNLVGGIAQGFRAPNMEDFFGRVDFLTEIPNTELSPEKVVTYDVGVKYYAGPTSADVRAYRSDYTDLIDRVTVSSGVVQRRNINAAEITGIEAGVRHEFSKQWRVHATLTWTEGTDKETDEPLRRIPPLNGVVQIRYTTSPNMWWELETLHAAKQDQLSDGDLTDPRIPPGGTPGYTVFNLKYGFKRTKHEQLLVTLENITDEKYKTHGSGVYAAGFGVNASYNLRF